jgi:hypothetical protein
MRLLLAAVAALFLSLSAAAAQPAAPCAPSMGLSFVCGLDKPEDLIQVPGSRWLIASGMGSGAGLKLVDSAARTAHPFYTGGPAQIRQDRKWFSRCPGAPDIGTFNTHGIALRPSTTDGVYRLYAVMHAPLESIQVFAVDARGDIPQIRWTGCVPLPQDFRTNAVSALQDGTILVNVQMKGTTTNRDFIDGHPTGGVFEWKPGRERLRLLPGTELAGNNGFELSPDEREFYVAVSGTQTVAVYALADTAKPVRTIRTPWFNLDNIHWSNGRLIAAGMMYDEPACGGTRKQILDQGGDLACKRGWVAAQLDPAAMTWTILAYGEPNPAFGGIATALVIGDTLWISSYSEDRVAYRPLPGRK